MALIKLYALFTHPQAALADPPGRGGERRRGAHRGAGAGPGPARPGPGRSGAVRDAGGCRRGAAGRCSRSRRLLLGLLAPVGLALAGPLAEPDPDAAAVSSARGNGRPARRSTPARATSDGAATTFPSAGREPRTERGPGAWEAHGRPARLIIVRPGPVDTSRPAADPAGPPGAGRGDAGRAGRRGARRLGHRSPPPTARISAMVVLASQGRAEPARRRARPCSWPAARRPPRRRRSTPAAASWPRTGSRSPRSTRPPASRCRSAPAVPSSRWAAAAGCWPPTPPSATWAPRPNRAGGPASRSPPAATARWCAPRCCATAPGCG